MMNYSKYSSSSNGELREQLASIEHERWADWQKYCNAVLRARATDERTLEERLQAWDKQIETPYEYLSDKEKASDMEQVDRYWPLIEAYTNRAVVEARLSERCKIAYFYKETDLSDEAMFRAIKKNNEDAIKQLTQDNK